MGCTPLVPIIIHFTLFIWKKKKNREFLKFIFIEYIATQKDYKYYHPPTKKTFVSMDFTFEEFESYFSLLLLPL